MLPSDSSSTNSPSYRLACLLYQRLETALISQCAQHYDAGILLRWLELRRVGEADDATLMTLRVDCRGTTQMPARVTISRVGRTLFDVCCSVEEGTSHRFSYSLPVQQFSGEGPFAGPSLPTLGRDLATFLRTELETRLGRLLLQGPAGPPRTSFPGFS